MKTRHYSREETDTYDEVNKVVNELRGEIVLEFERLRGGIVAEFCELRDKIIHTSSVKFEVVDDVLTELSSRIAKLEKPPKKESKKKQPSAKSKKK